MAAARVHTNDRISMSRSLLILTLAWALLLLPVLCAGGLLVHPCDCGTTIGCEHETDCDSDPCEIELARTDSSTDSFIRNTESTTLKAFEPTDLTDSTTPGSTSWATGPPPSDTTAALPYPPSDLPLLI